MPGGRRCRSATLPECFEYAHTSFLIGESSRRGKAGAAWGCRPTEHPLPPFPARWPQRMLARQSRSSRGHSLSARYRSRLRRIRSTTSFWVVSSSPLSESARLLGKAGVSVPVGSPSCGLLGKRALTPSAYFGSFVSGGSASGSHQRLRCSRTLDRKETLVRSSPTRQAAFFSTLNNSPRSPAQWDA